MWLFLAVMCSIQQTTFSEESTRPRHLNPQQFMTISEIIHYWGYPHEEYDILTDDGYYLKANRIPYGIHSPRKSGPIPVVLLVPGLVAEGRSWIANLPNNSLGFFLADAGYDVWIINNRGTTWSRRHQNFTIDQQEFWNFTFHEMGIYDIPAAINFILQKTQQDGLYYLGHSQGGAIGFIAFSELPQLTEKVKLFMSLAPAYTLAGLKGPMKMVLSLSDGLKKKIWGTKEFQFFSKRMKTISTQLCSYPGIDELCLQLIYLCAGFNDGNLNVSRVDTYLGIYPDFSSVKTIVHWSQVSKSKEFKYFDYGAKNKAIYNTSNPPFYKIEDMMVPTAIWSGGTDIVTTAKDADQLRLRISNLVFNKTIPEWNHADFIWDTEAPKYLFPEVLNLMQMYQYNIPYQSGHFFSFSERKCL
ncbi:lysosomal acid lipase/cholesteryl ester hydrolase-like [Varanus komodoensis]|uniref:lysosomal acid lipase/cholesteryl ester hydrolase-like n=1 Tax=Varanus komodoensis TaxID=61221 RepID=UPI001CF783D6|nr:lysosomal acid lipase/cholesteryl ester hydrolase-like [Varanus komodoensis]